MRPRQSRVDDAEEFRGTSPLTSEPRLGIVRIPIENWPRRLVVRTHAFHACSTGSTPVGVINLHERRERVFTPRGVFRFPTNFRRGHFLAGSAPRA